MNTNVYMKHWTIRIYKKWTYFDMQGYIHAKSGKEFQQSTHFSLLLFKHYMVKSSLNSKAQLSSDIRSRTTKTFTEFGCSCLHISNAGAREWRNISLGPKYGQ